MVEIPLHCPWWEEGSDGCDASRHHWRKRSTGPCHPLAVVKCHHGPAFTLYPPGHFPYGRGPAAPVSVSGEIVRVGAEDESETPGELAWYRTLLAAALDAARGVSWSRESPGDDPRRRRTQQRHIAQTATLLGLVAELDEGIAQQIADCLGVAYLVLSELRRNYRIASTYVDRGAAIVAALELVPVDRTLGHRLLMAGFIGGLWGRPERWDPG